VKQPRFLYDAFVGALRRVKHILRENSVPLGEPDTSAVKWGQHILAEI
jgi:hypothetical protein